MPRDSLNGRKPWIFAISSGTADGFSKIRLFGCLASPRFSGRLLQVTTTDQRSDVPEPPSHSSDAALNDETRAALRLSLVPHVGPHLAGILRSHFGSASNALEAPPSELRLINGIGPTLALDIARANSNIDVDAEIARCKDHNIDIIPLSDPRYPKNLCEIPDPPQILYVRGNLLPSRYVGDLHRRDSTCQPVRKKSRFAAGEFTFASGTDGGERHGSRNRRGRTPR